MQPQTAAEARGTGREGREGRGQSIQAASHTSSPAAAPAAGSKPACTSGGEASATLPICAGWFLRFWLHPCFKEVFIFCQFSACFLYKQNLCLRSITPTDVLWFSAKGRMNPKSRDWWEFLFPYLPLIQRACSPWSLMSSKALFAKCCFLWYVF